MHDARRGDRSGRRRWGKTGSSSDPNAVIEVPTSRSLRHQQDEVPRGNLDSG